MHKPLVLYMGRANYSHFEVGPYNSRDEQFFLTHKPENYVRKFVKSLHNEKDERYSSRPSLTCAVYEYQGKGKLPDFVFCYDLPNHNGTHADLLAAHERYPEFMFKLQVALVCINSMGKPTSSPVSFRKTRNTCLMLPKESSLQIAEVLEYTFSVNGKEPSTPPFQQAIDVIRQQGEAHRSFL